MTFTSTTIRRLRELNLEQTVFDKVLEIFEEAQLSKPKKKGSAADKAERATRLPQDWVLPSEWREWALSIGVRAQEVARESGKFKDYWLNCSGSRGIKLSWQLTWKTWCYRMLERAGREPIVPTPAGEAPPSEGPDGFTDATWKAIAKRVKAGHPWNPEWGPPPGRMDCRMPVDYL